MGKDWDKEEWRKLHAEYLKSFEWSEVRKAVIERDGHCKRCRKTYEPGEEFEVHHTSYRHWGQGNYHEVDDCILLCACCHSMVHFGKTPMQKIEENLEKYLGDV